MASQRSTGIQRPEQNRGNRGRGTTVRESKVKAEGVSLGMFGAIECLNDIQHKCKSISNRYELGVNATHVHTRMGGAHLRRHSFRLQLLCMVALQRCKTVY